MSIKAQSLFFLFLSIVFLKPCYAEKLTESDWLIKAEIQQLVDDYAIYRDSLNAEAHANLFSEDGEFIFRGTAFTGREALRKRIIEIDPSNRTMHIMTSSQIRILDDQHAEGSHYVTVYAKTVDDEVVLSSTPIEVSNFAVIGIYNDEYVLTDDGWKISKRSLSPIFTPEN